MSVDCQRIQDVVTNLWIVPSAPLQIILVFYMLNSTLGVSFLAGVAVILALVPINARIASLIRRAQAEQFSVKDERVKMMNEVLNGIKVLKMYAWEPSFEDKIRALRDREVKLLRTAAILNTISNFCWICSPVLVTLAVFLTYVQTNGSHRLEPDVAFVSLTLLNILRQPVNMLPSFLSDMVQAHVSLCRIRDFLSGEDINGFEVTRNRSAVSAVHIENGWFTWDTRASPALQNISLKIPCGKLTAVVGTVGAGKSSLLAAILGEMKKVKGEVTVKSDVSYLPQEPWIQNCSFRDNIVFGHIFNERWYRKVIRACALKADIDLMPGGDIAEIGEKGVNMSGGQKQRLSLARAVYHNADLLLFDDPLSAVDTHVGKHIFKKVFSSVGVLKHKTRVLVTHAVHFLPSVDYIIVMDGGHVTQAGSYEDLMSQDGPFAQYLLTYLLREVDDALDDPEIQKIRYQMLEKVEYVTSDGLTSADEEEYFRRRKTKMKNRLEESLKRHPPVLTRTTEDEDEDDVTPPLTATLITEEKAEQGKIQTSVIKEFARAYGLWSCVLVVLMLVINQGVGIVASIWLSLWTGDPVLRNGTLADTDGYTSTTYMYMAVYCVFGVLQGVTTLLFVALVTLRTVAASKTLHAAMLNAVMRQPISFFDTTPLGRVMNRFSRDVDTVDGQMAMLVLRVLQQLSTVVSVIIVISYTTPLFVAAAAPIMVVYYLVQKFYVPSSRQLRRLESTSRSPVYSHFSETINGVVCIRAFGARDRFVELSARRVDSNNAFFYAFVSASRWLRVRLELLGNLIVLFSALFAVLSDDISGSLVGLSVSYALQVTSSLNVLVQNCTLLESTVISVERIVEYSKLPQEAAWLNPERRPTRGWPRHGDVIFQNYSARYRAGLNLVLKSLTCHIKGGEKVGIVGRTGAGKSSLSQALFRMVEPSCGSIIIDGVDISDIGLHDLRARLTVLPQDPVLFSGSLRFNLDPFDNFTDDHLWNTLEKAQLKDFVTGLNGGLLYPCGEGGRNLSVGQRQLVCLARCLLKKTKVLILDEATAAVDMETDEFIQQTVRTAFKDCTVFTIAHRINTVLDHDKILVLEAGEISEFDTPSNLLSNKASTFYGMAREAKLVV
ncbi:multidrug resistance-associated protein 1-like isoform X2 [Babylonia areolata]